MESMIPARVMNLFLSNFKTSVVFKYEVLLMRQLSVSGHYLSLLAAHREGCANIFVLGRAIQFLEVTSQLKKSANYPYKI